MSRLLTFSSTKPILRQTIYPPIVLDRTKTFGIGLLNLYCFNTIANIHSTCNKVKVIVGSKILELTFPTGLLRLEGILNTLLSGVQQYFPDQKGLTLTHNVDDGNSKISINSSFGIDFVVENSIGKLLGFTRRIEPNKWNMSDSTVNILGYNTCLVKCSLATDSYVNGVESNVVYTFTPSAEIGYRIIVSPNPIIYLKVNTSTISFIELSLVSEDGRPLDLQGELISYSLHLKEI